MQQSCDKPIWLTVVLLVSGRTRLQIIIPGRIWYIQSRAPQPTSAQTLHKVAKVHCDLTQQHLWIFIVIYSIYWKTLSWRNGHCAADLLLVDRTMKTENFYMMWFCSKLVSSLNGKYESCEGRDVTMLHDVSYERRSDALEITEESSCHLLNEKKRTNLWRCCWWVTPDRGWLHHCVGGVSLYRNKLPDPTLLLRLFTISGASTTTHTVSSWMRDSLWLSCPNLPLPIFLCCATKTILSNKRLVVFIFSLSSFRIKNEQANSLVVQC